jgi:hypothetical protein
MIEFLFVGGPAHGNIMLLPDDTYSYLIPVHDAIPFEWNRPPLSPFKEYKYDRRQGIILDKTINLMCHLTSEKEVSALFFDALKVSRYPLPSNSARLLASFGKINIPRSF